MTGHPSTAAMIAARRAAAAAKEAAVERALTTLVRRRATITISAVAAHAGVSRSYLSRHATLGPKPRAWARNRATASRTRGPARRAADGRYANAVHAGGATLAVPG